MAIVDTRVECRECGFLGFSLVAHVGDKHGGIAAYQAAHPDAPVVSEELIKEHLRPAPKARRAAGSDTLALDMMGMTVPVDAGTNPDDCLPLPGGYQFPSKGKAKAAASRALVAMFRGRNVFIHGMPGTGKDALVHAYSAKARRPVVMVTFRPGTDLAPWFYVRSIGAEGTGWDYGHLWRALTEGMLGRDGKRSAPLVLLSDVDRADTAQAEWFRILTDSISGRILNPEGKMTPLFRDEWGRTPQFVCTANSVGTGDARGRMASSNPMDASILDRLGHKIEAHYLDWGDEGEVLRKMFPKVWEVAPHLFIGPTDGDGKPTYGELGNATRALREAIKNGEVYGEYTMRGQVVVLEAIEDYLFMNGGKAPKNLLRKGFEAWLEGLGEDDRFNAAKAIDPHIGSGSL